MFGLDLWEVLIIVLVALVVVGPRRLPEVARTLGKTMRELRRASNDLRRSVDEAIADTEPKAPGRPALPTQTPPLPDPYLPPASAVTPDDSEPRRG